MRPAAPTPRNRAVNFSFTWRHWDGSLVTFSPGGWTSSDPEKAAWLNAMSDLTSSEPVAPPLVRIWLAEECQLVEVHRTGGTEAGESAKRESKQDDRRVPPEKHSKCLANDGNPLRIAPRSAARPKLLSALEGIPPSTHTGGALILPLSLQLLASIGPLAYLFAIQCHFLCPHAT